MFGLKAIAIALLVGLSFGGVAGWRVTKAFDDSRWFKAQTQAKDAEITTLKGRIKVINDTAASDAARAQSTAAELAVERERVNALQAQIADGACFDDADSVWVRQLWGAAQPKRGSKR